MTVDVESYSQKAMNLAMNYGPDLILAILTLVIGSFCVNIASNILNRSLEKVKFDETLKPYLVGIFRTVLRVILYISVIGMLGIKTTSFIAVLGAAGLAVGMALQGSLGNFAGGVLILLFKPIKKGDVIDAQGVVGVVDSIQPFVTVVTSFDNIVHYIPNGALSSSTIKNFSVNEARRVDLVFGIGYGDNIDQAKEILLKVAKSCPNVLGDLEIKVFVTELAGSSVNIAVRPYCAPGDYPGVHAYMLETVKKELDKANISIPFPQRDVHIHNS